MDQLTNTPIVVPASLRILYAPIADKLEEVEALLRRELSSDNPFVDRLVKHGFRLGGKRLRPALVLLSAEAVGGVQSEHILLAAMAELIHTATLIHDDVLDEATIRRHLETINARWDNEASILLGDFLFARAMCLASALDDVYACRVISDSARMMCQGELMQIESRGNFDMKEAEYLEIIAGKTAALTACCCQLGAHYAGADATVCDALARYGRHLGVAFQIADDLLDLLGSEQIVGKSLGTDLAKKKATLPLIRLLDVVGNGDRAKLMELLSGSGNHHRDALRSWCEQHGAIAYADQKARWFTLQAANELTILPANPAVDALRGLTDFVVNRRQ